MLARRSLLPLATMLAVVLALVVFARESAPASAERTQSEELAAPSDTQLGPRLRVGIKPLDPFVVRTGSHYSGFSIELWDEIARRNGWTTEYVWQDTLPPLLDDVSTSRLDVAIAGISITREREARLDFSHPMFNAGLQVIAPARTDQSWFTRLRGLASASLVLYLLGLVVVIVIAGNVVWFFERKHQYARGVGYGMFRAAAVGLVGELGEPGRPVSDVARVVWAIIGICFVSAFTASLTTELTVQQITGGIRGVNDLGDKRVVTVAGSTAAQYLLDRRIAFEGVDTVEDAFSRVEGGQADAMVFDAPVLHHHMQVTGTDQLTLVGSVFQREDYGIALPTASPLREAINATLLEMRADGTYDRIYEHYFGRTR